MDKPKIEYSQGSILSYRRDRPPPPPTRMPANIHEAQDLRSEDRPGDPVIRNIFLGIGIATLSVMVFVTALFLAGPEAPIIAAGSACVSVIVLRAMARMGVHRQPGGFFLSAMFGVFVAMFVPLAMGLVVFLNSQQIESRMSVQAPEAPKPAASPEILPRLTESFAIEPPDSEKDDYVRVIRNSNVAIEGKEYRIATGELFPLYRVTEKEVIVKGRDFLISLPPDVLQVVRAKLQTETVSAAGTERSTPVETGSKEQDEVTAPDRADISRKAQNEATKRYPALGIRDTAENRIFLDTYRRLRDADSELLKDPEWPLQLAEALAEREGWKRADVAPVPPPPRPVAAEQRITAESPDAAPGFPPFDPTPPPLDELGESMALPQ
jgi:hypothetical protein